MKETNYIFLIFKAFFQNFPNALLKIVYKLTLRATHIYL